MAAKRKKKSTFNVKAWECVAAEWAKFYNPNNQIIGWTGWNYNMQQTNSKVSVFPTLDGEKEARRLAVPNFGIIPYTGTVQTDQLKAMVFQGPGSEPVSVPQPLIK